MNEPDFRDREAFDPDERELCSDGSCTGLVGVDGVCKVCGKRGDGAAARKAETRERDGNGGERGGRSYDDENERMNADENDAGGEALADGDDDRRLCPDGNCLGLIGPDGNCKVCGLSAAS